MARHALIHRDARTDTGAGEDTVDRPGRRTGREADRRPLRGRGTVPPHAAFGGTNWGACFFGWLVAVGVTVLLGTLGAAAALVGIGSDWSLDDAARHVGGLGATGGVAAAVIAFVGCYTGGYVAGRMSRFDAVRQGVGVWLIGVLTTAIAAGLAALLQTRSGILADVDLSARDLIGAEAAAGAALTVAAVLLVTLLGAVLGSTVGRRYHRRIDAAVVAR
jgi:hypothetical protein